MRTSKTGMKFALAAIAASFLCPPASLADPGDGFIQPFTCPPGSGYQSSFVSLPPNEEAFGFGKTNKALELINATGQVVQLGGQFIDLLITSDGRAQKRRFTKLLIAFKDDGTARNSVVVRVCFRNLLNSNCTSQKRLRDFHFRPVRNQPWIIAEADASDFLCNGVSLSNVVRMSIFTNQAGPSNFTLGKVTIDEVIDKGPTHIEIGVLPQELIFEDAGCAGKSGCTAGD